MSMTHIVTDGSHANKRSKRKGRGDSSGKGKTAGRGTKGTGARAGKYIRRGYEGGQTEVYRRFPKRGFSNHDFENRFNIVNLGDLQESFNAGETVDVTSLYEKGLVKTSDDQVKILGDGDLKKALNVQADWYSKSAIEKITAAGGKALNTKGEAFAYPKEKGHKVFAAKKKAEAAAAAK
jgi:large subunit ribosomal protein L15